MSQTVFLRLLQADDKATALADAVASLREGHPPNASIHLVGSTSFGQVPGSPFAYWVSDRIRCLFKELQPFECEGRAAKQGLCTADDFRFLRSWWEVRSSETLGLRDNSECMSLDSVQRRCRQRTFEGKRWVPFSKGGAYSPYYADLDLVANWEDNGVEIQGFSNPQTGRVQSRPRSVSWYFLPGLTWTWRSQRGFNVRAYPAGSVFAHIGPVAFTKTCELTPLLGLCNSKVFCCLVSLQMAFGSYPVGVIHSTPVPDLSRAPAATLREYARSSLGLKCSLDTANETSHVFHLPALLQAPEGTLAERVASWRLRVGEVDKQLAENQREIDDIAFRLYGIEGVDRRAIEEGVATAAPSDEETEESEDDS